LRAKQQGESAQQTSLDLTVEEAIKKFPEQAGITRFGKPEELPTCRIQFPSPRPGKEEE
jgi:hypothetical protein